ncbi:MAG TPA: sugar phosphate isomerase/epimerase family protein [Pirellulales bacterium]|nr:sugar phosphate isomerase/epimerase family protein [Pirellulales bacterium]
MPAIKIGIKLASFGQPLRQSLASAHRLGGNGVELEARGELRPSQMTETAVRQVRKLLDDYGLRPVAISFPTRRGYDVPDEIEERIAGTKAAIKLAYQLKAPVVVIHAGCVPPEPVEPQWNQLVEVLSELGRFSHRAGALLAAQTGSEGGPELARLIAALPGGSLGVDFDPASLIVNGNSPLEAIESLGPHILHVHATDAVRDLARGRGTEVAVGRGTADFPNLIGKLEEYNYRGYFTVGRQSAADPLVEIGAAIEYLKSL